jgi:hypothetical protein
LIVTPALPTNRSFIVFNGLNPLNNYMEPVNLAVKVKALRLPIQMRPDEVARTYFDIGDGTCPKRARFRPQLPMLVSPRSCALWHGKAQERGGQAASIISISDSAG